MTTSLGLWAAKLNAPSSRELYTKEQAFGSINRIITEQPRRFKRARLKAYAVVRQLPYEAQGHAVAAILTGEHLSAASLRRIN